MSVVTIDPTINKKNSKKNSEKQGSGYVAIPGNYILFIESTVGIHLVLK
jgi:hypothetical protein